MKRNIIYAYSFVLVVFALSSCVEDDYLINGGVHSPYVNKTTFDFLKTHQELDTFAYLIERAGLVEAVNAKNVTLFACTDYSVRIYLRTINNYRHKADPYAPDFTVDDIPQSSLDSLKMYIFNENIERDALGKEGVIFPTALGDEAKIYLIEMDAFVRDNGFRYSDKMRTLPEIMWYSRKRGTQFDEWDFNPNTIQDEEERKNEVDVTSFIRTSGIISNTGTVHVLDGMHTMFFRTGDTGSGL